MTRRIFAVAAIATALTLAPAAAFAYEADDFTNVITPTGNGNSVVYVVNGPVNTIVNITVSNPSVADSAISIAGVASASKTTNDAGEARFTITVAGSGTYTIEARDAEGNLLDSQVFTASLAGGTGGTTTTTTTTGTGSGSLPVTGSSVLPLALGAGALAAAGVGAVVVANKRREGSQS